jgi:hypothetical protein
VERLPGIRMAGNAEDVLVRREHLQNGQTRMDKGCTERVTLSPLAT